MPEGTWSLPLSMALFSLVMVMVIAFGLMMTRTAAVLAKRTGLGEAVMGHTLSAPAPHCWRSSPLSRRRSKVMPTSHSATPH